ncbi:16S rRNA (cytosine(967)-C(5))-methyltransferase RsmB [Irregularibacter muris]|uniref:16S rRNA (cytosine(967)-C(5))-methyltransferase n=1 Tax=Irregularibacter muris TaxID=1796619 RepID=A0AAE3L2A1_9FIRM|nr:16S rRNA (cytosine(967)-C(5))-methyltransferase RsmB [Irregularibacter muris]MCR1898169.1 16S rRNA (cytosine(967)-C(5))-methyltransferase RsmB [Irregularibacter muris]
MKNNILVDRPREIALKVLYDVNVNNAYSNISLKNALNTSDLSAIDRAFITQLVYGVVRNKSRIDWIISKFSKTPIKKISPWVQNILRLGIYQIVFLDKVPKSAAVNESVKLGKKYGHHKIGGYINGVLRHIIRANSGDLMPERNDEIKYLSIIYSHPKWLVKKYIEDFGPIAAKEILEKNNLSPDITIRTNTLKISREELMELLSQEGFEVKKGKWCAEAIIVHNISNIEDSPSFKKGLFQIQDQSSMLVAHILNPLEDQLVIDTCAAPGGKTTHIAQIMKNTGKVIARDIYQHKLTIVKKNVERLGITNIQLEDFDALKIDEKLFNKADRVLVDAPCSGLGIIRRKPDLKWNKNPEDIASIREMQIKILQNASNYVKKDGFLVYSTCTINPEENQDIIEGFLDSNSSFKLLPIEAIADPMKTHEEIQKGYLQIFPHVDDIDGFFICRMQRI